MGPLAVGRGDRHHYSGDNTDPDVDESRLGAVLSFMIDPATEGAVDLNWSTYQEEATMSATRWDRDRRRGERPAGQH